MQPCLRLDRTIEQINDWADLLIDRASRAVGKCDEHDRHRPVRLLGSHNGESTRPPGRPQSLGAWVGSSYPQTSCCSPSGTNLFAYKVGTVQVGKVSLSRKIPGGNVAVLQMTIASRQPASPRRQNWRAFFGDAVVTRRRDREQHHQAAVEALCDSACNVMAR